MISQSPEQILDEARAAEALRVATQSAAQPHGIVEFNRVVTIIAARLAREGWRPHDPLLLEARDLIAAQEGFDSEGYRRGDHDETATMAAVLCALRRGIEIGLERGFLDHGGGA